MKYKNSILILLIILLQSISAYSADEVSVRLWFDNNSKEYISIGQGQNGIDTKNLKDGIHWINGFATGTDGIPSSIESRLFIKHSGIDFNNLRFILDGKVITSPAFTKISDESASFSLPVSDLKAGLHTLGVFYISETGSVSSYYETIFMKVDDFNNLASATSYFIIDGKRVMSSACSLSNGIIHADVDVSEISDGFHSIDFMCASSNGLTTQTSSSFFIKIPNGGYQLSHCDYWVNEDMDNLTRIPIDPSSGSFSLVSLIALPKYPFKSSSFKFELDSSAHPILYAKNDVCFMFAEKSGRFTVGTNKYVDRRESIGYPDVKELARNTDEKKIAVHDNEVIMYKVKVEYGDSVSFRLSHPVCIEIFDPESECCYSASGIESMKSNGFRVLSSGDYYIALHDPVNKNIPVTLTYTHIDKYALVDYTPRKCGDDGFINMDLRGNGLLHLTSAELYRDGKKCIADTVVKINQTYSLAQFILHGKDLPQGSYDLSLQFHNPEENEDTTLVAKNALVIEEATRNLITTTLSYNVFKDGNMPHKGYVIVENKSNVGAGGIPVNIAVTGKEVYKVEFDNFRVNYNAEEVNDSTPLAVWRDEIPAVENCGYFMPVVLPYLGPNEQIKLNLNIWMSENSWGEKFGLYGWVGKALSWRDLNKKESNTRSGIGLQKVENSSDYDTCEDNSNIPDWDDLMDIIDEMPGNPVSRLAARISLATGEAIAGIIQGLSKRNNQELVNVGAVPMGYDIEDFSYKYRYQARSPRDIALQFLPDEVADRIRHIYDAQNLSEHDCPKPTGWGGLNHVPLSWDPNDIFGYTNECDGRHVGIEKKSLDYRVEFENDSTMATMPANKIVISSFLDKNVFDLESFKPLSVKFGQYSFDLEEGDNFIVTYDMRPKINALAEVSHSLNKETGESVWTIQAIHPLTLEPIKGEMFGILAVNDRDHNGEGSVAYQISLKDDIGNDHSIDNSATITFDGNDPIKTKVWHNVTDYIRPASSITEAEVCEPNSVKLKFECEETGSGLWYYDVYCNANDGNGWKRVIGELTEDNSKIDIDPKAEIYFCVIATDKAGNREEKELTPEIIVKNNEVTTSIEIIDADKFGDDIIYTLSGIRVDGRPRPGIYISNGKKILIR